MHEPNAEYFGGTPYYKAPELLNHDYVSFLQDWGQLYSTLTTLCRLLLAPMNITIPHALCCFFCARSKSQYATKTQSSDHFSYTSHPIKTTGNTILWRFKLNCR
jgi:serine/threonine protein kinase